MWRLATLCAWLLLCRWVYAGVVDETAVPLPSRGRVKGPRGVAPVAGDSLAQSLQMQCRQGTVSDCTAFYDWLMDHPDEPQHKELLGECLYNRGSQQLAKGYTEKARADFEELQRYQPNALATHMALADVYGASVRDVWLVSLLCELL
jgi:hypothetical protein